MKFVCIIVTLFFLGHQIAGSVDFPAVSTKMAQGICTSILPYFQPDLIYAVKRLCSLDSRQSCQAVCSHIGKECYNSIHIYRDGIVKQTYKEGRESLRTYRYDTCAAAGCGPNFCCCADKKHVLPVSYKDAIAQASCIAMLPLSRGDVYAVRRDCFPLSKTDCELVCYKLKKKCFNSIHVYDGKNLEIKETGEVGLRTYRYNTCRRRSCGPNFCCCTEEV